MVKTLIYFFSKVNTIQPSFTRKLGSYIRKTIVGAQKIDSSRLGTFGIIITSFLIEDKDRRFCFFVEMFLLVDIYMNVAFEMFFFHF